MTPATTDRSDRPPDYYEKSRDAIVDILPASYRRVLDIGCGRGVLGQRLKEISPGCTVHGVELDPEAADSARRWLDRVVQGDATSPQVRAELARERCDLIVCADVLEHLVDPWEFLRWLVGHVLSDQGHVVVSLPNVRHLSIITELVWDGEFEYRSSGIMDTGHLRFFTDASARRLFRGAGLAVSRRTRNRKLLDRNRVTFWFSRVLDKLFPDLFAMQYHYLLARLAAGRSPER